MRASPSSSARSTSIRASHAVVVDASSIETATELVHATGLSQWNTVEVVPVAHMTENLDAVPIVCVGDGTIGS
jgi:hypothetical protein